MFRYLGAILNIYFLSLQVSVIDDVGGRDALEVSELVSPFKVGQARYCIMGTRE